MWLAWRYCDFTSLTPDIQIVTVLRFHSALWEKLHLSEEWTESFRKCLQRIAEQHHGLMSVLFWCLMDGLGFKICSNFTFTVVHWDFTLLFYEHVINKILNKNEEDPLFYFYLFIYFNDKCFILFSFLISRRIKTLKPSVYFF